MVSIKLELAICDPNFKRMQFRKSDCIITVFCYALHIFLCNAEKYQVFNLDWLIIAKFMHRLKCYLLIVGMQTSCWLDVNSMSAYNSYITN